MSNAVAIYVPHPAFTQWATRRHGGHQLLNEYWKQHLSKDPNLRNVVFCFQVLMGNDREIRFSSKRCGVVSSTTGESLNFLPILGEEVAIEWGYEPASANSEAKSISISIPNEIVDAAALIREARILSGIAEVSLMVDGGEYDDRLVLLRGDVTDVSFGALDQLVSFTITDPKDTVDLLLPPYTITAERFENVIDESVGKVLAIVAPEFDPIEAHAIDASTTSPDFVVAYGVLTISSVYVEGVEYASGSTIFPWQTKHGIDLLGAPYTAVDFTGGTGTFDGAGGETVYVGLSGGPTNGNIVQIIKHLVEYHTTIGISGKNPFLFSRAEARSGNLIGRCAANASGSSQVSAISFIEGTLLESFPMISMCWWGGGYGPVFTDRNDSVVSAQLIADQWPILDRATSITETPKSECCNSFSLYYDYDPLEDTFRKYTERTPFNSAMCELSRRVVGERHADPIESLYITEQGTAEKVMDWFVSHKALPAHDVQYEIAPQLALQLMLGDNVHLTDDEFGWVSVIATVLSISFSMPKSVVTFRVWNNAIELSGSSGIVFGTTGS